MPGIRNQRQLFITGRQSTVVWKSVMFRMKEMEKENAEFKKMFAEASIEIRAMKEVIEKKF